MKQPHIAGRNLLLLGMVFCQLSLLAQKRHPVSVNGQPVMHNPRQSRDNSQGCPDDPYRSLDGTCNNLTQGHAEWGATDIPLFRALPAAYGPKDQWNAMGGEGRPSPRAISNTLCVQKSEILSKAGLSALVFAWGQFIDHDIDLTPEGHVEYVPIPLTDGETWFKSEIPFFRSEAYDGSRINDFRQQANLITSWIDASNVYGSNALRAAWLRTHEHGKMKMSTGNLLPYNTLTGEYNSPIDPDAPSMAGDGGGTLKTFVAGDVRAAEQPGLTALHTLFLREHNAICDRLVSQGKQDDETIYQEARKEVGALIQAITYQEFLPALGVRLPGPKGYDDKIQPDIVNLFATAAYRLGHTMVTPDLWLRDDQCNAVGDGSVDLVSGFFNPQVVSKNGIDALLEGMALETQYEVDPFLVDQLRNLLFGDPTSTSATGLDLASLNIQRGRDHGLPDYNTVRNAYTGRKANDWKDITRDKTLQEGLKKMYTSVDDIDLWVGLLTEDKQQGSSLGKTLQEILKKQFVNLRDGDRYFYKYDKYLKKEDRDRIEATMLADIIERNTSARFIDRDVFHAQNCSEVSGEVKLERRTEEENAHVIKAYPNPFDQNLTVELSGISGEVTLSVYDVTGKLIKQVLWQNKSIGQINISGMHSGIYVLKIDSQTVHDTIRLLKIN
ncbi:MAG: T9SS type A sorting domain-containing protein [Saprospiraceae bacterium]|nr:T9SS type A sorting domain-containing protein [Saprospiraceae bacterium]MCB9319791.1 T9SS type A sorting domain-containing protein [Lewinellaceae bacterium]